MVGHYEPTGFQTATVTRWNTEHPIQHVTQLTFASWTMIHGVTTTRIWMTKQNIFTSFWAWIPVVYEVLIFTALRAA